MTDPSITILLDRPQHQYDPGEMLSGEYRWDLPEDAEVRRVELSVLWHSEGKGDEDMGVHFFDRYSVDEGDDVAPRQSARFSAQLPLSPFSYDGAIVKIRWCVRVRIYLRGGHEMIGEREFQLGAVPSVRAVVS